MVRLPAMEMLCHLCLETCLSRHKICLQWMAILYPSLPNTKTSANKLRKLPFLRRLQFFAAEILSM
jgi:hypothetical protein